MCVYHMIDDVQIVCSLYQVCLHLVLFWYIVNDHKAIAKLNVTSYYWGR